LTYAPGFTFYRRESSLNQADQNASIDFQYRLGPQVTISARDGFQKTSNVFNQPDLTSAATVSGGAQDANFSVIAPIANSLRNAGNVGITDQFAINSMVGASGTFSNLHYPNSTQVPGLFDSSSQGGAAFYSRRISQIYYVGGTYEYQRLVSYLPSGLNQTHTDAVLGFLSIAPTPHFWVSLMGGPQYANTIQPAALSSTMQYVSSRTWTPAAGASLSWQGHLTNVAASYLKAVSGGGGLVGAVRLNSASVSVRQQITRSFSGAVIGQYAQNDVLGSLLPGANSGHSLVGMASLQQQFGPHVRVELGYTRLHQSYNDIAVISAAPNTNREFVAISYQFSKAVGK
jgi:hypothetical protein